MYAKRPHPEAFLMLRTEKRVMIIPSLQESLDLHLLPADSVRLIAMISSLEERGERLQRLFCAAEIPIVEQFLSVQLRRRRLIGSEQIEIQ